jgi:hypothetical protein
MRDQRKAAPNGLACDQDVIGSDWRPGRNQRRAQFPGMARIFAIILQNLEAQGLDPKQIFCRPPSPMGTKEQLVRNDGRQGEVLWPVPADPNHEAGMALQKSNDSVGIEKKPHSK